MAISLIQHSRALTSKVVGAFVEEIKVRSGFNGWFPRETTPTLEVDVEVQRDNDLIAVDVVRFTEGNKNKFSRLTEHKYIPPFFKEEYDFQRDQVYMNTIALGVGMESVQVNAAIAKNAVKNVKKLRNKIERAIAKQQADVLQTGIVTMVNGDNIDYRRKAESMVVSANPWSNPTTAKPIDDLKAGMSFLRHTGNSGGAAVNVIMSGTALGYLLASDQITKQGEYVVQQIQRINLAMPQFEEATGFTLHGRIAAGDFVVNLWTYEEKYTNDQGQTVFYLKPENVIMIPSDFQGKLVFGGLYTLNKVNGIYMPQIVETDYLLRNYSDEKTVSSTLELTSAPLVIPFTIDKMFTLKAY